MKGKLLSGRRWVLSGCGVALLLIAFIKTQPLPGGQAAIPLSRPGQEHITFWVNHGGLDQYDVEGEVGFGDMARILMRRRSNTPAIQKIRDRFTFQIREMRALDTPDVFRVEAGTGGLRWRNKPERFIIAAGPTFNLPLLIDNTTGSAIAVQARFESNSARSAIPGSQVPANSAAGYFLRVVEPGPGNRPGKLTVQAGQQELTADIAFDVRPLCTVHVRLLDERGASAAARVYVTASDGLAYAPRGNINRMVPMSAEHYFYAQDSFEMDLPAGDTTIEATRGLEYDVARAVIRVDPLKPQEVALKLTRWEHMAQKGWYSSDAHIHANYTSPYQQVITPRDIRLQTLGEDLNNANLMVANSSGSFLHDMQYFEGKPHRLSLPDYIMYWNEEMRHSGMYGHMSFYNLKTLVYPLYTGFRGTEFWEDYPPNYTQAAAAQKQGGAVTYVHPAMQPEFDQTSSRELPVDLALGQVDAMDVLSNVDEPASMQLWYRLLNCGFRLAISAGSDSFTNVADHYIPGGERVYVHTGSKMDYGEWIRSYKRGRSFATNGPMVLLTIDGRQPGDEIRLTGGAGAQVRVRATLRTRVPVEKFEIIVNGEAAITRTAVGRNDVDIDEQIVLKRSSWVAARALGPRHRLVLNDPLAFAHTSPVYVYFGDQPITSADDARFYAEWVQRLIDRVEKTGRFAAPERKQEVIQLFQRALDVYRRIEKEAGE